MLIYLPHDLFNHLPYLNLGSGLPSMRGFANASNDDHCQSILKRIAIAFSLRPHSIDYNVMIALLFVIRNEVSLSNNCRMIRPRTATFYMNICIDRYTP